MINEMIFHLNLTPLLISVLVYIFLSEEIFYLTIYFVRKNLCSSFFQSQSIKNLVYAMLQHGYPKHFIYLILYH